MMDLMVDKYLVLAGITYGTLASLATAQILLCVYLIASGIVLLSSRNKLGKWASRFGLIVNLEIRKKRLDELVNDRNGNRLHPAIIWFVLWDRCGRLRRGNLLYSYDDSRY